MKIFLKNFLKSIAYGLAFCVGITIFLFGIKARSGITSTPGDKLTSSKRNELVNKISQISFDGTNTIITGNLQVSNNPLKCTIRNSAYKTFNTYPTDAAIIYCNSDEVIVGGGCRLNNSLAKRVGFYPTGNGYFCLPTSDMIGSTHLSAYAICCKMK